MTSIHGRTAEAKEMEGAREKEENKRSGSHLSY